MNQTLQNLFREVWYPKKISSDGSDTLQKSVDLGVSKFACAHHILRISSMSVSVSMNIKINMFIIMNMARILDTWHLTHDTNIDMYMDPEKKLSRWVWYPTEFWSEGYFIRQKFCLKAYFYPATIWEGWCMIRRKNLQICLERYETHWPVHDLAESCQKVLRAYQSL